MQRNWQFTWKLTRVFQLRVRRPRPLLSLAPFTCEREMEEMMDWAYIAITIAFFALTFVLLKLCASLGGGK
jgi:hypothetical protein